MKIQADIVFFWVKFCTLLLVHLLYFFVMWYHLYSKQVGTKPQQMITYVQGTVLIKYLRNI